MMRVVVQILLLLLARQTAFADENKIVRTEEEEKILQALEEKALKWLEPHREDSEREQEWNKIVLSDFGERITYLDLLHQKKKIETSIQSKVNSFKEYDQRKIEKLSKHWCIIKTLCLRIYKKEGYSISQHYQNFVKLFFNEARKSTQSFDSILSNLHIKIPALKNEFSLELKANFNEFTFQRVKQQANLILKNLEENSRQKLRSV